MKTRKQIERALETAERRVDELWWELQDALKDYCARSNDTPEYAAVYTVLKETPSFAPLAILSNEPLKISTLVTWLVDSGKVIYREDYVGYDAIHTHATKREISRLVRLENKVNTWNTKRYWLECVLDDMEEDGTVSKYCEDSFKECVRELAALGYSIE